jgi:MFS family permease
MASEAPQSEKPSLLKFAGRAFHYRNYRLFFMGQGISTIGTWMQQIAMSWLVYRLTDSAFFLGLIGFTSQIPTFILGSFAGVLIDRVHRRNLIFVTQILSTIQAFLLAFLTLSGYVQVWHLVCLSLFLGSINAFDMPTRQSFVVELVEDKKDLGNAIALNSFMFNSARLIGPSIAGVLLSLTNEGICFLINAVSFFATIMMLLAMKIPKRTIAAQSSPLFHNLKEGYAYAFGFPPIRYALLLLALVSLMGMPYVVLMPVFARDILHGGPRTLGFLMAAGGTGALIGALHLASRRSVLGLGRLIVIASSTFGAALIAFSFSRSIPLSLIIMFFAGSGMITHGASTNTILQTIVEEDKRGRVMSFYTMAFMGMAPLGSLLAGFLASRIGAPNTLMIGGAVCIVGSLLFLSRLSLMRKMIRPIYAKMGIIGKEPPEV